MENNLTDLLCKLDDGASGVQANVEMIEDISGSLQELREETETAEHNDEINVELIRRVFRDIRILELLLHHSAKELRTESNLVESITERLFKSVVKDER